MYKKIRQEILSLQDKKYQEFHSSLCPGTDNIIGVRVPVLRNYAKKISKQENIKEYIFFNKTKYYEEVMLQGMLIGLIKNSDIKETLSMIENFVPKIDNWAVCDICCAGLKAVNKNKETVWNFIQKYLKSKKEFELRFAIVMMLDFFIDEKYIDKVLTILDNIKHDAYYVKMAVAWTISVAFVKFQDKTMKYLKQNNLDDWTYNKSLQKICESLRVDKKTKEKIKKMKRI
ncbi:MAG: DNA alkylation repair protein [Endomicrobiaceae bacterium]|nr:DNA alkylation repair protein [Endomicrobiaceae bacterium]